MKHVGRENPGLFVHAKRLHTITNHNVHVCSWRCGKMEGFACWLV